MVFIVFSFYVNSSFCHDKSHEIELQALSKKDLLFIMRRLKIYLKISEGKGNPKYSRPF